MDGYAFTTAKTRSETIVAAVDPREADAVSDHSINVRMSPAAATAVTTKPRRHSSRAKYSTNGTAITVGIAREFGFWLKNGTTRPASCTRWVTKEIEITVRHPERKAMSVA